MVRADRLLSQRVVFMTGDPDARPELDAMAELPPAIHPVDTTITAFVGRAAAGPVAEPVEVASVREFADTFGENVAETTLSVAVRQFFENGGQRAIVVRVQADRGQSLSDEVLVPAGGIESGQGIFALEQAELFNLLVIPPLDWGVDIAPATLAAAAAYCLERRAFLIVGAPIAGEGNSVEAGKAGHEAVRQALSSYPGAAANAALYVPRALAQVNGGAREIAASGAIAGVIARTDRSRGVWTAPAGMEASLQGISGLSAALTDSENGELNRLGINCLRVFPGQGPVIWGARTLEGSDELASDWKYIPVRRLALLIEESIDRGTRWARFEPNDETLWSRLRLTVGNFLLDLFRQGALQGQTPDRAFFVKCDQTTTTQSDIDSGHVNIMIGIAPLKPAEFVILRFQQRAGQPE
jgi:phage tail sheath protein FI